jgi:hypothetical protein
MARVILPSMRLDPAQEQRRLDALARYDVLDSPPEEVFDGLTRLVKRVFSVSMSTLTFVDGHRQWFKSRQGVAACETDRGPALCYAAIQQGAPLIITDAAHDEQFRDNPFVTGEPHIRFYAGFPLRSPEGEILGTLCVMDGKSRPFSAGDRDMLGEFGALAIEMLEMRRRALVAEGRGRSSPDAHQTLAAGQIAFNSGKSSMACTVRSLSRGAAAIDVINAAGVPDRVALVIASVGVSRLCTVTARSERRIELAFES